MTPNSLIIEVVGQRAGVMGRSEATRTICVPAECIVMEEQSSRGSEVKGYSSADFLVAGVFLCLISYVDMHFQVL